jgi:hypothetical protein
MALSVITARKRPLHSTSSQLQGLLVTTPGAFSLTQGTAPLSACLHCNEQFTPGPRRGKPQVYCGKVCQVQAANARRASTRSGRTSGALRTPKSVLESPESPSTIPTPPEAPTPVDRLAELMAKAHSRVGVTAWEIATIAKLRGISAWAPVSVIIGKEVRK